MRNKEFYQKGVAKGTSHVMCVVGSIPCMAKVSENDLQQGEQKGRKGVLVEVTEHCGNIDVSKSKQNSGFKTTLSVD